LFPKYPYIIAEAGINHNGDLSMALRMVEEAYRAGADAIKFQIGYADEFTTPADPLYDTFKRCEFTHDEWRTIKKHADDVGITWFATPQNISDLEFLLTLDPPYIKIGSDDFTNLPMLKKMRQMTDKPFILSCGMSTMNDITDVMATFDGVFALMVCTSLYPTPYDKAGLRRIRVLRKAFPSVPVGFSDHTPGILASLVAIGCGAVFFEKHFTLSNFLDGPDHSFSSDPRGLELYCRHLRMAYECLGDGLFNLSHEEQAMKEYVRNRLPGRYEG